MLLAELTRGATFDGPDGAKWVLTESWDESPDKTNFSIERVKVAPKEEELLSD